ncbi:Protein translocase subunit SecA [subsurface metagenome]
MIQEEIQAVVNAHFDHKLGELDSSSLLQDLSSILPPPPQHLIAGEAKQSRSNGKEIAEKLSDYAAELYNQREQEIGADIMRLVERQVMLRVVDRLWMEHLTAMDRMRRGIALRAVGQQNPLVVYKREGHSLFEALLSGIQYDVVRSIYHINVSKEPPRRKQAVVAGKRVGRNAPCPCGSGKKYKHCCGK